ncbi:ABC transporter ATP-binding protein [Enterococcus silesiacus]|uniref:ABC-type quaternary amine transporter n=1 Tax=Enterococcus silesiacus TaxID=332949 RepID=A0A0S3KEH6_9ENTE|nr:ABC transporter ATP-binding protein [Enterococcus silesiacus]ALS02645.1 ABC transporter ATP-binding protein [Enterococcus silesiacus]OJG93426.1 glycine betaine/carnitine/choline ABC transporter ATP-binding protein [Enterococcus silesiacus]
MINFQNVSKKYNDQLVLEDFDVSIEDGEFFVLVGPSGSGKTTTLKMINRLIEPTDGDIYFNDQRLIDYNLKELRLTIGYVLQQIALFPNLTVAENIELIPEMKHWNKAKRRERTEELLRKVSLSPEEYLHRKPAELSGGEQQRIGILRAIAAKPDIILMDEPFSALDPISRGQLQLLIKELHKELASTVVFVTHDMNEALLLGDRICVMKDGKIVQTDTPEEIKSHPANEFVAQFFQHEHANLENYCAEDLLASGFIEDGQVDSETTVNLGTNLPTVIRLLVDGKTVVLVDEKGPIGEITDRTILRFLETKIEKGDQ